MNAGLLALLVVIMLMGMIVAFALCRFAARMDYREAEHDPGFDDGLGPSVSPALDLRPGERLTDLRASDRWPGITPKSAVFDPAARAARPFFDAVSGAYIPAPGPDPDEADPSAAHYHRMEALSFGEAPDLRRRLVLFRNPSPVSTPMRAPWSPPH